MFAAGWLVVAAGEAILLLDRRRGPVGALIAGDLTPFGLFWAATVAIGLSYEIANYYFPVWRWTLADTLPRPAAETFIIGFGYFVLFHPLALAWRLGLEQLEGDAADKFVQRD
jgi:hypothetical protein